VTRPEQRPRQLPVRCQCLLGLALLGLGVSCRPLDDNVFELVGLQQSALPWRVPEGMGQGFIPIRLTRPASQTITVNYHAVELSAQDSCQLADFEVIPDTLVWKPGETVAQLPIWIQDDTLAETDERFKLVFDAPEGVLLDDVSELEVEIEDDDRSALIDARAAFGVLPNSPADQSRALQAALDAAAMSGRGVLVLAPGDYQITSVSVHPGTTLSGSQAVLHRPPGSAANVRTLVVQHSGPVDSAPTLIEGVSVDGQRDAQGGYLNYERELANLVEVQADPALPGRLLLTLESLNLSSGTGDGIGIGTNVDASFCHLRGNDLWRDMLSARGGNTRLRIRDLNATASSGKTGLWADGGTPGYSGTHHLDLEFDDLRLETGDLEIDVSDASKVNIQRLIMTEPPFRLVAVGSTVTISDSVITTGIRVPSHNYWGPFQNLEIKNSTLRVSENDDTGTGSAPTVTAEADRVLTPMQIQWPASGPGPGPGPTPVPPPPPAGSLLIENCRFDQASDVEATDTVYAVSSRGPGPTIRILSSLLPATFKGWFAPGCGDCQVGP
jgi:hypothetical protein